MRSPRLAPSGRRPGSRPSWCRCNVASNRWEPWRTGASLARLNQRHGFDCPGCAWPEEHGGRKFAEFCENGAKAVAEEATKRVGHAGFLRPALDRRPRRPARVLAVASRADSPSRWCCARATTTTSRSTGTTPSRSSPTSCALSTPPTRPSSTPPVAPATRRRSSTSCWSAASAPTTCPTAPTCATSPRAPR